jgi:polar amino acid transport system substrate-binding protein
MMMPSFRVAVSILLGFSFSFAGRLSAAEVATSRSSGYDRMLQTRTLRVGYIHYPPGFIRDPNKPVFSGIMHDVLMEIGRNADVKIEFVEEVAWGTMIEAIRSGRVDLVCTGLWPSTARAKLVDFTAAVYYSPVKAYAKSGRTTFNGSKNAINSPSVRIAAIDGEMSSIISRTDFPKARLQTLPQTADVSQLLLEVSSGKADVTFVEPAIAKAFLARNPDTLKEVEGLPPLRVFPNVLMVAKGDASLKSMLDVAIEELSNTGFVDSVIGRYEVYPNSLYRRAASYQVR